MSERRADSNLDQAMATWMNDVAPERPPARLLEGTFARTMKARQARVYPWHKVGIGGPTWPRAGSGSRTGLLVLVALAVTALGVGLVAGGFRLVVPPMPSPSPTIEPARTEPPTPATPPPPIAVTPEAVIPVVGPIAMVSQGSAIWVMSAGELARIDPIANAVTGSVTLGPATELYNGLAANDAGLWATNSDAALLYRVDPETRKVVAAIPAGSAPKGVLANDAGVWVADANGGVVLRIDPATNTVMATTSVGPARPTGPNLLGSGLGSNWVAVPNNWTIARIDPVTDTVQATIPAPDFFTPCGGFGFDPAAVWVTGCTFLFDFQDRIVEASQAMARIDPATNTSVATIALPGYAYSPTMIDGAPWLSIDTGDATTGMLVRIDPATNLIDRVLVPDVAFGGGGDIVLAAGSVWVVDGYNNVVLRLPLAAFGT